MNDNFIFTIYKPHVHNYFKMFNPFPTGNTLLCGRKFQHVKQNDMQ